MAIFGDFLMLKVKTLDKDGTLLEEGKEDGDLYIYGLNSLLPALDLEIGKMEVGEEKEIELPPEKAYGPKSEQLIRTFPLKQFKEKPMEGELIEMHAGGQTFKGIVKKVESGRVTIDFNHPYAGKTLKFRIKLEAKAKDVKEKIEFLLKQFEVEANVDVSSKKVVFKDEESQKKLKATMQYLFPEFELVVG